MAIKWLYTDANGFYAEAEGYSIAEFLAASAGAGDAGKPIKLDAGGKLDASFIDSSDVDHSLLQNLAADDHQQYILVDGTRAFTGNISMGSFQISNLADGVAASDAVNKGQLDQVVGGIDWKESVQMASTANLTLSGEQTIDGVLSSASRILVKDQAIASENGIYITAAGAWVRSADADQDAEVTPQMTVAVEDGSLNSGSMYKVSNTGAIVVGTTSLVFIKLDISTVTSSLGVVRVGQDFRADLVAAGGIKLVGNSMRIEPADFSGQGLVDDGADNLAIDFSVSFNDLKAVSAQDLNSTANGNGASIIGIEDSGAFFTSTNMEGALQELAAQVIEGEDFVLYTVGASSVTKGDLVYISGNDTVSRYDTLANPDRIPGIAFTTEAAASSVRVIANDEVVQGVLSAATAGDAYYWNGATLTTTMPGASGDHVYQVGFAKNATDLQVEIKAIKVNI